MIGFYVGDRNKSHTLADTGYKFIDKRINRQVQNNNPIMTLVGYLSYKVAMRCKEVRKLNERGTTRTCSCCGHVIAEGLSPSVRTFTCPECGFTILRDLNSTLNFLNTYQFAVWYGLRALQCLSIARLLLNPSSGKKRRVSSRTCVLNCQDACSLLLREDITHTFCFLSLLSRSTGLKLRGLPFACFLFFILSEKASSHSKLMNFL